MYDVNFILILGKIESSIFPGNGYNIHVSSKQIPQIKERSLDYVLSH